MIAGFLATAKAADAAPAKAVIAPHAGYIYSGPIAGSAFASWTGSGDKVQRVVLIGPSHRLAFDGVALTRAAAFATPFGSVPVDQESLSRISSLPQVRFLEAAHEHEHSLEVELPFLQRVLGDFALVPLVVGEATDAEVAEVLERLWGGPETRFVISSDLSHYYDYETAKEIDQWTAEAIEALRPADIGTEHACGRIPIRGLLEIARQCKLKALTVDLRNSGDTAGSQDQVVGYGAFVLTEPPSGN